VARQVNAGIAGLRAIDRMAAARWFRVAAAAISAVGVMRLAASAAGA
jgi:hypothetical protein